MEQKRIMVFGGVGAAVIAGIVVSFVLTTQQTKDVETKLTPSIDVTDTTPAGDMEARDAQRYRDVTTVRIALNGYSGAKGHFPASLTDLVPTFLAAIPADPGTGKPYTYVFKDGAYTLSFMLEQGAISLASGDHFLTPRGFDVPAVAIADREITPTTSTTIPPELGSVPVPEESTHPDTDEDELTDAEEIALRTDSSKLDTDGDGLADGDEVHVFGLKPLNPDTDGDGFSDGQELGNGFDPITAGLLTAERKALINAAAKDYGIHPPTNITLPLR